MDCPTCFAKYVLCLFNFIIFLAGAAVLALGVWINVDKDSFLSFAAGVDPETLPQLKEIWQPGVVIHISYVLIAAGAIIFLLSLVGYCAPIRESRCLLGFYGFLLVLIIVLEVTAAGLAYAYKDKAEMGTKEILKETIKDYYTADNEKNNPATAAWNTIMVQMSCCGVDNYTDFSLSPRFRDSGLKVPIPCCKLNQTSNQPLDPDCPRNPRPENSYYLTGCYKTLMDVIMDHMNIVIYVIVGLVIIELLATFLTFCLCKSLQPYDK